MSQREKSSGVEKAWQILQSRKMVSQDEEFTKTEMSREVQSSRQAKIRDQEVRVCKTFSMNSMENA